jgi:hypothetical protein
MNDRVGAPASSNRPPANLPGLAGPAPTAAPASSNRPPAKLPELAGPAPTDPAPEILAPFQRPPGRALMLGHVHPDADVLGTLLALGAALEGCGWRVVYGGPHPAPGSLGFLPGIER